MLHLNKLLASKLCKGAVCFVNVADRGLRPKRSSRKQKRQQAMLAFRELGAILPNNYYTPEAALCQGKS
jgi:hypothetical protein